MQNVKRIFPRRIIFKIRSFVRFSIRIRCFRYRFFFLCVCFYENFYKLISFSVLKTKGEFSLIEHDSKERLPANFVRSLKSQPPRIIITTEDSWPSSFYVRGLYYSASHVSRYAAWKELPARGHPLDYMYTVSRPKCFPCFSYSIKIVFSK